MTTKPSGYLWIDQICIDQSSVRERNHQVGMMASIYSGCYQTIIWIGRCHSNPDALCALKNLADLRNPKKRALQAAVSQAVVSIANNSYFTRLWVVQEIILSNQKMVLCSHPSGGAAWIKWLDLAAVAGIIINVEYHVPSLSARYLIKDHLRDIWMPLFHAVRLFSQSHCQDPRDKVYGLLGLVKEEQRLTIDYGKPLQNVFLDTVIIFYRELAQKWAHSFTEYQDELENLSRSWGIMSASLDAFLYEVWLKPTYDGHCYPHIEAMDFIPAALNQNIKLMREELLPYSEIVGRDSGYFEPSEWIPTKDCWCYEANGITYEIYGLVSSNSLHNENVTPDYHEVDGIIYEMYGLVSSNSLQNENVTPGYYGRRIRKTQQERKSRMKLPSWMGTRPSFRSA